MKRKFTILIFIAVVSFFFMSAQTLRRPVTAGYTTIGAYSINHTDVFSYSTNQASLAQLKNTSVGVFGEKRFLLSALNNYAANIGLTTTSGNFGIKANYFGFSDYNETQLGLAYGRKLGNKVDIGVQFNYNRISISSGYGNASAISFELGTILHLTEKINAGFHVNNPVGGKFGKNQEEKLSSVYAFGLGYEASEKFFISAEIEKEEDRPVNVNAGFQYKFIQQLLVRAGISTATSAVWIGAGITLKSFRVDITTSYNEQLGISPGLMFIVPISSNGGSIKQNN